jgi:integrase
MRKKLTAAGIERYKPAKGRREIGDAAAPGLYLVLQPSGHRSWAMRFRRPHTSKPVKLTLGPYRSGTSWDITPEIGRSLNLVEARYLAGQINRQREAGVDVVVEARRKSNDSESFGQTVIDFIDQHKVRKTGERPRTWRATARVLGLDYPSKKSTVTNVTVEPTIVKGSLCERWYSRPLGEIDGHDVHAVISEATRDGVPGLGARTDEASDNRGRRLADALGAFFRFAMRHRRAAMKTNPMIGTYRPALPPARDRILSAEEIKALWRACDDVGMGGKVVRLLLLTGCRLNEVARLTWDEVSDDLAALSLPGRRTKNALPHTIPLAPMAREIITSVKRLDGCPYVFTNTGKGPLNSWSKLKRQLDEAVQVENCFHLPWRFHDLRRTCATGMAEIGVAPHIVEAALNHVSGARANVAGIYNRAKYAEEKKAALARWASYVEGIVEGRDPNVIGFKGRDKTIYKG